MSERPEDPSANAAQTLDPRLQEEVLRLFQVTVYARWLFVGGLWLTVGSLSLWNLRHAIRLWLDYFTWAAVRYTLVFNRFAAAGLGLCLGMTLAVLVWQSRVILWGLPAYEQQRLSQQVIRIRVQGETHPLWKWVCGKQKVSQAMGQGQNNHH